jgi:hypothetical protein
MRTNYCATYIESSNLGVRKGCEYPARNEALFPLSMMARVILELDESTAESY